MGGSRIVTQTLSTAGHFSEARAWLLPLYSPTKHEASHESWLTIGSFPFLAGIVARPRSVYARFARYHQPIEADLDRE
jgi:hypothetical protein